MVSEYWLMRQFGYDSIGRTYIRRVNPKEPHPRMNAAVDFVEGTFIISFRYQPSEKRTFDRCPQIDAEQRRTQIIARNLPVRVTILGSTKKSTKSQSYHGKHLDRARKKQIEKKIQESLYAEDSEEYLF